MSRSFINFGLITFLFLTGCTSQAQFLANKQPTAIQAAVTRGQFEMNCPSATGQVLSQEVTQPAIQGPRPAGRRTRSVYDRRCRLRPTASLSSLLSRRGRQLHGARRSNGMRVKSCRMRER